MKDSSGAPMIYQSKSSVYFIEWQTSLLNLLVSKVDKAAAIYYINFDVYPVASELSVKYKLYEMSCYRKCVSNRF